MITYLVTKMHTSTIESYLGATVERLDKLDNELVNFANTMIGALIALAATHLYLGLN